MTMPERKFAATNEYRYGFNGKENDKDAGEGIQDYGMRIYDVRIAKFLSVDPLSKKFPYYSTYQFAGNMPIWAIDLDGGEPDFKHVGNGIYGVGLFSNDSYSTIEKHKTKLTIGTGNKKFQMEWFVNANGDPLGYLMTRIVPEEEYKRLYNGTGEGLQEAYIVNLDKLGEFTRNIEKYYDYSHQAELYDVLWGEIDRDPIKKLFDPRAWLLSEVGGVTANLAGSFLKIGILQFGKLSNLETRIWYNEALKMINTKVPYTEANAKKVSNERAAARQTARALMKDRAAASKLDETDPIQSFDFYKKKYSEQGFKGEELWKKIIEGSIKPNTTVNSNLGIQ